MIDFITFSVVITLLIGAGLYQSGNGSNRNSRVIFLLEERQEQQR